MSCIWFFLCPGLRFPPYVFLEKDEYVRIVGEKLRIHCTTHNPNFNYNVTWNYSSKKASTVRVSETTYLFHCQSF